MKNLLQRIGVILCCCVFAICLFGAGATSAVAGGAVNLMLKNDSSSAVQVEMIDQYGGNFTATIEPNTSQNQTLKVQSEIKVGGNSVHMVTAQDEGKVITVASP